MFFLPIALLFTDLSTINFEAMLIFVVVGILTPTLSRLVYFKGLDSVGVSVNTSLYAMEPLYSSVFASIFLSEVIALPNWIGIFLIISGAILIERSMSEKGFGLTSFLKKGAFFPIIAALIVSITSVTKKYGLLLYNEPLLGFAVGNSVSLVIYITFFFFFSSIRSNFSIRNFKMFWKPGLGVALGALISFYALSYGMVSVVAPIVQIMPLFVLLLTYLYLKELEKISSRFVINTIIIVIGAILVSIR